MHGCDNSVRTNEMQGSNPCALPLGYVAMSSGYKTLEKRQKKEKTHRWILVFRFSRRSNKWKPISLITYFLKKVKWFFTKKRKHSIKKPSASHIRRFTMSFKNMLGRIVDLNHHCNLQCSCVLQMVGVKKQSYKNHRPQEAFLKTHIVSAISIVTYIFAIVKCFSQIS